MPTIQEEFINLRQEAIKKFFSRQNDRQFEGITTASGPVLILAGAGSGKTTVLVNRIASLVKFGDAYNSDFVPSFINEETLLHARAMVAAGDFSDDGGIFGVNTAKPWEILAITFTNKAAGELKDRIAAMLGEESGLDVWAGTFHSTCAKILRRFGDRLGYSSHFTIYDTDDQKRLMKDVYRELQIDDKFLPVKSTLNTISNAKDSLISPDEFSEQNASDVRLSKIARAYKTYQKMLHDADAMDFDDIIVNTVRLLKENPDVLEYYQHKFKYIMVDEYQDTNHALYVLVSTLAEAHRNICVVGDDDQSIYRFRGATIENILSFEEQYRDARVIRLEQNYRSTSIILDAANAVIAHNEARKGKSLWTAEKGGDKISVYTAPDEQAEASYVVDTILNKVAAGGKYCDNAVLYRTNAQSNAIENVMARSGVPYRVIGGHRFYDRKEIKDCIAYLNVIANHGDKVRLTRIVNEPKRGIGDTTVSKAAEIAGMKGTSMFEVFKNAADYPTISRAATKLKEFTEMIEQLSAKIGEVTLVELFDEMLEKTGYMFSLVAEGREGADRVENVKELASSIAQYEKENEQATLSGFLEEVALISDIDQYDADADAVVLMTIHSAKSLEFENVHLVGMEEGLFPGNQSIYGGPEDIEEERRLAYVAITRAKKRLHISNAYTRMLYGQTGRNLPSRFLEEIPKELCDVKGVRGFSGSFGNAEFRFGSSSDNSSFGSRLGSSQGSARSGFGSASRQQGYGVAQRPATGGYSAIKPSFPSSAAPKAKAESFAVGCRVKHKAFGEGMVLSSTPMGNDTLLEIAFDQKGTKKLMANFAKLEKI